MNRKERKMMEYEEKQRRYDAYMERKRKYERENPDTEYVEKTRAALYATKIGGILLTAAFALFFFDVAVPDGIIPLSIAIGVICFILGGFPVLIPFIFFVVGAIVLIIGCFAGGNGFSPFNIPISSFLWAGILFLVGFYGGKKLFKIFETGFDFGPPTRPK